MPGLTLWTANHLERLAQALALRTRDRAGDPLAPETIVIQSRGMERWLALEMARHTGIAANLTFPFPEAFLQTALESVLPDSAAEPAFNRESMTFAVHERLVRLVGTRPEFAPLAAYLRTDDSGVRRFQLAEQIAYLFDQYLVFRPDTMLAWDDGRVDREDPHQVWQALLWQDISQGTTGFHRARLWQRMLERLGEHPDTPAGLPRRVSVFGISYLPPIYLQTFAALAAVMTVDYYHLNPCREYWADIVSRGEGKRLQHRLEPASARSTTADDLHLEEGHRLLASLGRQGRAFQRLVGDCDVLVAEDFQPNPGTTLLAAVQNDILRLRDPASGNGAPAGGPVDGSIQVHACHSPMREIEVLHDQLLDLLNADPGLAPGDIMVLTPDIDTYAPYVQAVFGVPEDERQRLPFSIADRSPLQSRPLVETFLFLLELEQFRFQASQVLAMLALPAVRARFDLAEEDLALVDAWVADTRVRWGLDADFKTRFGLPPTSENTWQAGLDRLLMGYALPADRGELSHGILPARGVEGSDAEALGRLIRFVDGLRHWQNRLSDRRTIIGWSDQLMQMIDFFFRPDIAEEGDLLLVRRLLADMRRHSEAVDASETVGVDVVRTYLKRRLAEERSAGGFIAGGITFGALLPMRSIPAKVVCLVGMNQDVFPREDRPLGFDLMAAAPRLGDRSRRSDDKYLFLEALISARRCLYISYVGYAVQDNARLPPSVLVSELMDYLYEAYGRPEKEMVIHHRLQPFAPEYFQDVDAHLFSYSRENRAAAASLVAKPAAAEAPVAFLAAPLPPWSADFQTVEIQSLARALTHPCRFLLERRLQLRLAEYDTEDPDRERFQLDALERHKLGQDLVDMLVAQPRAPRALEKARAAGRLPHGSPGLMSFEAVLAEAETIAAAVRDLQSGGSAEPVTIDARIPPFTLTGRLEGVFPAGQVWYRFGGARGPDLVAVWLRHLVWCRMAAQAPSGVTTMVSGDGCRRFRNVDRPDRFLEDLLALYHRAGHEPVAFFPRASWTYAHLRFEKGLPADKALERVRAGWQPAFGWPGEGEDPYIRHCFSDVVPLNEDFAALAEAVYEPILRHSEAG